MAKVSNAVVVACLAQKHLRDLAALDGADTEQSDLPELEALVDLVQALGPDEDLYTNRKQEQPNTRGYIASRDVAKK